MKLYDVIVIGGGASGMITASAAAMQGADVLLLEKNVRLGEKLRITGGGRCNITNTEEDLRLFLKNYGTAEKFLYSAFVKFGVKETVAYFEDLGLPIKVEGRKRAFPVSENAEDVVSALSRSLRTHNVEIMTNSPVTEIAHDNGKVTAVVSRDMTYHAKSYVLASGGASRPETGSTGDGFGWLKKLGHTVKEPSPNITPLALKEKWVSLASGNSAKSSAITFYSGGRRSFKLSGDILFTHFGISGPLILNSAYKVAELLKNSLVTAKIDLYPDIDDQELDQKIIDVLSAHGSKQLKNVISYFTPPGLSSMYKEILRGQVDFESKTSEVNKITRKLLMTTLKNIPITVDRLMGFERAVVADGGIVLSEIDTRTMRSNKISNLFITGDLLDINRPSGGFSLQLCWTTGYIAGIYSAQE